MKFKKFVPVITVLAILLSLVSNLTVSASVGKTILNYTFESVTIDNNKTVGAGTYNFKADGYDNYVLNGAWLKVGETVPQFTQTAAAAKSGSYGVQVDTQNGGEIYFKIPKSESESVTKTYKITIPMKQLSGSGTYVLGGLDKLVHNYASVPDGYWPNVLGGQAVNVSSKAWVQYSTEVSLDLSYDHYVCIRPWADMTLAFDDIVVQEVGKVDVTRVMPANASTKVSTYINPVINFDGALQEGTISNIKLMNGNTVITTENVLDSTGTIVTIKTLEQIAPNTTFRIVVPDTVKALDGSSVATGEYTFTTSGKNTIVDYDFEQEGNAGDTGMMFGYAGWEATKELVANSPINNSQAVKVTCTKAWHEFIPYLCLIKNSDDSKAVDNLKIEGSGTARTYKIEYDLYVEGAGTVHTYFQPTGGTLLNHQTFTASENVYHVEYTTSFTTAWDPCIRLRTEDANTATFYVDNLKVTEVIPENPEVTNVVPANGKTGVITVVSPAVTFDAAVTETSISNILLKKGDTVIETNNTLSTDGCTVTVDPVDKLSPFTQYTIVVPDTVKGAGEIAAIPAQFTFTTGDRNTVMYYDFEDTPASSDLKTEYNISSLWNSNYERTTEAASGGSYSFKVSSQDTSNTNEIIFNLPYMNDKQYIGRRYTISADFKLAENGTNDVLAAYLRYYANGQRVNKLISNSIQLTDEFTTLSYSFVIDEKVDGENISIWNPDLFINNPKDGSSFYIDNVTLKSESNVSPYILESTPADGDSCDALESLNITFSKTMDADSVTNPENYSINDDNITIEDISKNDDGSYTITFSEKLAELKDYMFSINGVIDEDGKELYDTISFKTLSTERLYYGDIRILKDKGEYSELDITDATVESGEISAEISGIFNYSGKLQKIALVQAIYENGKLLDADIDDIEIAAGDTTEYTLSTKLTVPEERGENFKLKAFLWETDTIMPIVSPVVLNDYEEVHLVVAQDGTGDYADISDANDSITDSGVTKRYVIDIQPGTYEEVNLLPKKYVTLKGTDMETCIIKGELEDSIVATADGRSYLAASSTINMKPTAHLENLTITAKNLRYPVHDEDSGANKNALRYVKNCYIEHFGNESATEYYLNECGGTNKEDVWQYTTAWGYGSGSGVLEIFDNTTFVSNQRAWYVHNNQKFTRPQINILNNCHMSCGWMQDVTVESMGSTTDDKVILNNCTFDGYFIQQNDYPWINTDMLGQYATRRDYDIILTGCDPIGFKPKSSGRALRINSNSTNSNSKVEISGSAVETLFGDYVSENGGGGVGGYTYGEWDISNAVVGIYNNTSVYNTIGKRLGDCSTNNQTLTIKFDGDENKTVDIVFNQNYFYNGNSEMLSMINSAISAYGYADEYNVTVNEFYPTFTDKELNLVNGTDTVIKRFAAVCIDNGKIRHMTSEDSLDSFAGVALENIVPGESGRILTEGYLYNEQVGLSEVANGAAITVVENGYELSGEGAAVLNCTNDYGWAYFKASAN